MRTVYVAARSIPPIPIAERTYHIAKDGIWQAACGYEPSMGWFVELKREPFELTVCAACRRIGPTPRAIGGDRE